MAPILQLLGTFVGTIVVVGVVAFVAMLYNRVVRLRRNVDQAWSNIDVLLTQRHEEIPKLVDCAGEYLDHERELLRQLTETRSRAAHAQGPAARADAEAALDGRVGDLFAVAEDYPELQASDQFLRLQERIADIETQIADRRKFYNASATTYNVRINQVPWIFFATVAGYSERELFEADESETRDVDVATVRE